MNPDFPVQPEPIARPALVVASLRDGVQNSINNIVWCM